ncbi:hypothetical protein [Polaromonas hydrogenivorans]|uniref:Uncharacterized protein n=1 Tax=Polaromonas hydrogenivorans TaxID=335476 RepID=A0AAU7LUG5_9BURK
MLFLLSPAKSVDYEALPHVAVHSHCSSASQPAGRSGGLAVA